MSFIFQSTNFGNYGNVMDDNKSESSKLNKPKQLPKLFKPGKFKRGQPKGKKKKEFAKERKTKYMAVSFNLKLK